MLKNIQDWFFHEVVGKITASIMKFVLAWIATPVVVAAMQKAGITLDMGKFEVWVSGALFFVITSAYHLYQQYQAKRAAK